MGSKDRLELESKVLAAALKQSHARGDTSGVSLAHKQIFLLLRQQQAADKSDSDDTGDQTDKRVDSAQAATSNGGAQVETPASAAPASGTVSNEKPKKMRKRVMPDIVWDAPADDETSVEAPSAEEAVAATAPEPVVQPEPEETNLDESGDFEAHAADAPLTPEAGADGEKSNFNAYGILQVDQIASFEEIHRNFLFQVRRVLMSLKKAKKKQRRPLLEQLQNLWIAHDILSDPVTRTDFDFRILGLRGAPDVIIHSAPEDKSDSISSRTPLRIGELMQCAGLLEPTELEIAADMHKAMPEMLFGAFLVKQGFISEEDLGQVLMGQRLLKNGNLTVGHYQMCMKRWRENQTPIEETAVAEGLVSQNEMERIVSAGLRDTAGVPAYQGGAGSIRGSAPRINAEEAAKRNLSVGHAVPQWKDQLDWSEPEAIEEYVAEDREQEQRRKPIENNLDIEGVTDGAPKETGKKSLRRLMEGIHSPEQPNIEEGGGPAPKSLKSILSLSSDVPMQGQVRVERLAGADESVQEGAAAESKEEAMQAEQAIQAEVAAQTEAFHAASALAPESPAEGDAASSGSFAQLVESNQTLQPAAEQSAAEQSVTQGSLEVQSAAEQSVTQGSLQVQSAAEQSVTQGSLQAQSAAEQSVTQGSLQAQAASEQSTNQQVVNEQNDSEQTSALQSLSPLGLGGGRAPHVVSDESTVEELAVDPATKLLEAHFSTSRPTTDVPVPKLVIEERSKRLTLDEDDENVFGEVDYDDEDDAESEADLAYVSDAQPAAPDRKTETPEISAPKPHLKPSAEPSSVNMDDLLDFSTPMADSEAAAAAAAAAEKAGISSVLDEAFHGVRVPELPPQAPAPEEVLAQRVQAEANFEAIAEEESLMQSGVYPIAHLEGDVVVEPEPHTTPTISQLPPQPIAPYNRTEQFQQQEASAEQPSTGPAEARSVDPQTLTSDLNLSSGILNALDSSISVNESSFTPLGDHAKQEQMKQHVGEEGFVIPRGIEKASSTNETAQQTPSGEPAHAQAEHVPVPTGEIVLPQDNSKATMSMEVPPVNPSEETTDEIEAVKITDPLNPGVALNKSAEAQAPPVEPPASTEVQQTDAAASSDEDTSQSASEDEPSQSARNDEEIPRSNDEKPPLEEVAADDKEDPQARLKSGEWQIVYKLQGSLADVFLSEEAEPDMPKMRPRLTEIDSIIPSSIAKMSKGDADDVAKPETSKEAESKDDASPAKPDATKSGDKQQSDKPVIKPVSNNYYRNEKGKKGEDKGKNKD
jgi:hypothetical protein